MPDVELVLSSLLSLTLQRRAGIKFVGTEVTQSQVPPLAGISGLNLG